jgi:hypothetical protein
VALCCLLALSEVVGIRLSSAFGTLVSQGHPPVDLYVTDSNGGMVGCASEPCTAGVNTILGATGTGCNTESRPETISITNPQPGVIYTLYLYPSSSYFASTGPGCPTSTTTVTKTSSISTQTEDQEFTVTITDLNTLTFNGNVQSSRIVGIVGCYYSGSGTIDSSGTVSGFPDFVQTSGVPEFPLSIAVGVAVAFIAFALMRTLVNS